MKLRTCVTPPGSFVCGIHRPHFTVTNLRENDFFSPLGIFEDGRVHENRVNFPSGDVEEEAAGRIFEVPNPFPFRGTTYIGKDWADRKADNPESIKLPPPIAASFTEMIKEWSGLDLSEERLEQAFCSLPEPLLLTLAVTSTDPDDLVRLAGMCCDIIHDPDSGRPAGLKYNKDDSGRIRAVIHNHFLFEALVNNFHLPNVYKEVMVLRPGAQGGSEIVGEYQDDGEGGHVFEYLRRNSYIPWGHYASNMANDSVRYRVRDLSRADMKGLRHLYYQRTYSRMARQLGLPVPEGRRTITVEDLEKLRNEIISIMEEKKEGDLQFNSTLWGWNFGFDFAPSRYRLHASHQQIHQQYAMLPATVSVVEGLGGAEEMEIPSYGCGDLVASFTREFKQETGRDFFACYIEAIRSNRRLDKRLDRESSLVVYEDENVMLFVPKAQTSQWELQLMTLGKVGNILEADAATRTSVDQSISLAMSVLTGLGARMITTIEFSKRFDSPDSDQRLLYSFMPRLPESPGAFSEAQLRFVNGHYPEDFARACRKVAAE